FHYYYCYFFLYLFILFLIQYKRYILNIIILKRKKREKYCCQVSKATKQGDSGRGRWMLAEQFWRISFGFWFGEQRPFGNKKEVEKKSLGGSHFRFCLDHCFL
ncbi:hypothetical protein V8G54_003762, partial [Vigna mungo]